MDFVIDADHRATLPRCPWTRHIPSPTCIAAISAPFTIDSIPHVVITQVNEIARVHFRAL